MFLTVNQNKMECYIQESLIITLMSASGMHLEFVAGTGDFHQAAIGRGHVVVIVVSPAVAAVAAVGEVATRRSQTS
jgi:hypothetical protein